MSLFSLTEITGKAKNATRLGNIFVRYDTSELTLSFLDSTDSTEVFQLPLRPKLLDLTKYNSQLPQEALSELIIDFENERILGKLIFIDLGYNIKIDSITMIHSRAYLF